MDVRGKLALAVCDVTQKTNYKCEFNCEKKGKCAYCLVMAENMIANGVTVQEWISVKDRLPNYFEHVLINVPGDKPFITVHEAYLRKDDMWDAGLYRYDKEDVTHWMPLPQPPKGE